MGISSERLDRVDEVIRRYIEQKKISGAVTLVARRGRVVHHEAQGVMDVESKAPMSTDTIFRMASSTKPVTGVAILMLIEEGKVGLTDPVSRFIPEFKGMKVAVEKDGEVELVAAEREVTIRDLLTHTSGLASGGIGQQKAPPELLRPGGAGATLAEGVSRFAEAPARLPARDALAVQRPGRDRRPGAGRGGRLRAAVRRVPAAAHLRAAGDGGHLLRRARRTGSDRLAAVHRRAGDGLEKIPSSIRFPETYSSGAGGLSSTAADYFRFAQMLANGGELDGKRLLSPRGVELYASNHVGEMFVGQAGRPKGMGFGLTVEVVVDPVQAGTFRSEGSFGWDGGVRHALLGRPAGAARRRPPDPDLAAATSTGTSRRR